MGKALLLIVVSACLAPLHGTTLQQLSLEDMSKLSSDIVRGTVQCTGSGLRGRTLYTNYRVQVTEQWKGSTASQIDFSAPGGSTASIRQTYAGAPVIVDGQEFVLFLWTGKSGLRQVIGLSQGLFTLSQAPGAPATVLRPSSVEPLLGSNGQLIHDTDLSMPLSDLRNRVVTALNGRSTK